MGFTEILGWVIMCNLALVGFIVMYIMYHVVVQLDNEAPTEAYKVLIRKALRALNITAALLFVLTLLHQFLIT